MKWPAARDPLKLTCTRVGIHRKDARKQNANKFGIAEMKAESARLQATLKECGERQDAMDVRIKHAEERNLQLSAEIEATRAHQVR